jgi:hypothetical protein
MPERTALPMWTAVLTGVDDVGATGGDGGG